jgi:anti-sigma regulatory factor (Ser/Thr protein kinase)
VSSAAAPASQSAHVVRFYAAEDELVDAVAHHVLDDWDGTAVIVATPEHRRLIEGRLAELGSGPRRTVDEILMLDAETVLHTFFDGERLDADRFDEVVGGVIRSHLRPLGPVRVYGEMVAVLWDAGQVNAALQLEQLWNELAATVDISLLCGYPTSATTAGGAAIARLCDAHSLVEGRPNVRPHAEESRAFAKSPAAPAEARQFVLATLAGWVDGDRLDDIVLVADELVTNGVLHGRSDVVVTLTSDSGAIRIAVSDRSAAEPRRASRGDAAMSGRGLHIVDVLSSAWGHQRSGAGKIVWARFDGPF